MSNKKKTSGIKRIDSVTFELSQLCLENIVLKELGAAVPEGDPVIQIEHVQKDIMYSHTWVEHIELKSDYPIRVKFVKETITT